MSTNQSNPFVELRKSLHEGWEKIDFERDYLSKVTDVTELNESLRDRSREQEAISALGNQIVGSEHSL